MAKVLMKGNEAMAEAAIQAGCQAFFGYPITPQSEIPEYFSRELPPRGGLFLQAESEMAAMNMVMGASAAGGRVMTSTSGPGFCLKLEALAAMTLTRLPAVIVVVMRSGPAFGTMKAAQEDYRMCGNGGYRVVTMAPSDVQEAASMVYEAFDIADCYRNPVMLLADGMIGQMMEPLEWHEPERRELPPKDWAAAGLHGRGSHNIINSLFIDPLACERHNNRLQEKYRLMEQRELRFEERGCEGAEVLFVAYGSPSRIVMSAVDLLAAQGVKAGLLRPITVWPYPYERLAALSREPSVKAVVAVEMSAGQMLDDVKIAVGGCKPISFVGHTGGVIPTQHEIAAAALAALGR